VKAVGQVSSSSVVRGLRLFVSGGGMVSGAAGGEMTVKSPDVTTAGNTGAVVLSSGTTANGDSGDVWLAGGAATTGTGGDVTVLAGTGSTTGGTILLSSGGGTTKGDVLVKSGGIVSLYSSSTHLYMIGDGASSKVVLTGGASGTVELAIGSTTASLGASGLTISNSGIVSTAGAISAGSLNAGSGAISTTGTVSGAAVTAGTTGSVTTGRLLASSVTCSSAASPNVSGASFLVLAVGCSGTPVTTTGQSANQILWIYNSSGGDLDVRCGSTSNDVTVTTANKYGFISCIA
jgi:hypothetical protein